MLGNSRKAGNFRGSSQGCVFNGKVCSLAGLREYRLVPREFLVQKKNSNYRQFSEKKTLNYEHLLGKRR